MNMQLLKDVHGFINMKKGQLKTGETIIVLIIFFILLAGGLVFYAKIQTYTNAETAAETQELDAVAIEQRIRHLAEISCTIDGTVIFDCYDLSKITVFDDVIAENTLYYSTVVFPRASVSVTSVYPTEEGITLVVYSGANESLSAQPFRTPVTLFDPFTGEYNFGYITIEVYGS